ncbi:hypothetical protein ERK19_09055 [Lactobacillus helsingborgensis]|uniref:TetR-like C-terminal domain-containing protein n=1 Tax=Lactobacillus helsingborgensis TaxID=1218494 RepID=UPI00164F9491|nr:TetR-like C-terminal domain-containing protein [Lactobacillus helsingborgensis]MBC6357493.1 hypothetical protein [Lactobacillus helsingborgensis]
MGLTKAEEVLVTGLSKYSVNKYTVTNFCKELKINRVAFYKKYRNICDLFTSVLALQTRRTLRVIGSENMDRMFYRMLAKIQENKIFYANLNRIAQDPAEFCRVLSKEYAYAIEMYMRPRGAFSVRKVEMVANGVYAIIFNWVLNECKADIRDIYQSIHLLLYHIEKNVKKQS